MLKHYISLSDSIKNNNFDENSVVIINSHMMALNIKTDKWYICHIDIKNGYVIDKCKCCKNKDVASEIMIKMIKGIQK